MLTLKSLRENSAKFNETNQNINSLKKVIKDNVLQKYQDELKKLQDDRNFIMEYKKNHNLISKPITDDLRRLELVKLVNIDQNTFVEYSTRNRSKSKSRIEPNFKDKLVEKTALRKDINEISKNDFEKIISFLNKNNGKDKDKENDLKLIKKFHKNKNFSVKKNFGVDIDAANITSMKINNDSIVFTILEYSPALVAQLIICGHTNDISRDNIKKDKSFTINISFMSEGNLNSFINFLDRMEKEYIKELNIIEQRSEALFSEDNKDFFNLPSQSKFSITGSSEELNVQNKKN